jgi:spore germination cell wall hydrolase CwlJ-like protein
MKLKIVSTFVGATFCVVPAFASPEMTKEEAKQRHCLAEAILFEAGNQPFVGKIAVGEVIMNRVKSKKYPNTICAVVHQGKHNRWWKRKHNKVVPIRNKCQFSYYCDGRSDRTNRWARTKTWQDVLNATIYLSTLPNISVTNGATHYHASYVTPAWSKYLRSTVQIQDHIFYK